MQRYAVVVDPLGTGQDCPLAFRESGVEAVAVMAFDHPIGPFRDTWHPENFRHIHFFDGDVSKLAETLRGYQPLCLIPGAEPRVELAEALLELGVPRTGHVPHLAAARPDKRARPQSLRRPGCPRR